MCIRADALAMLSIYHTQTANNESGWEEEVKCINDMCLVWIKSVPKVLYFYIVGMGPCSFPFHTHAAPNELHAVKMVILRCSVNFSAFA